MKLTAVTRNLKKGQGRMEIDKDNMPAEKSVCLATSLETLNSMYGEIQSRVLSMEAVESASVQSRELKEVNQLLQQASVFEANVVEMLARVRESGDELPARVKSLYEQTVSVVTGLISRIGSLEAEARQKRTALAPAIHAGVQAQKMRNAYSRTNGSGRS